MPAFTTNQWFIVAGMFLLGWLLGLLSRSSKKWRRAYEAERDARGEDQRVHAAVVEERDRRIAELERSRAAPVVPPTPVKPTRTAETLDLTRDDLARIRGIGAMGQTRLNEEGIYRYADIAALTPAEEMALEERMGADHGYIEQESWREQAALLAAGKVDEHRATFG